MSLFDICIANFQKKSALSEIGTCYQKKKKQPTNKIKDKQTRIDPQILFIEDVVHDLTKFDWYFLFLRTQIKTTCLRAVKIK